MTWVIGIPGLLLGGVAMADTRVTLLNGANRIEFDGVQKLHPVCDSMIAGFAGGVEAGFLCIESLQQYLQTYQKGDVAYPGAIITHCGRRLRRTYSLLPGRITKYDTEIMILASWPSGIGEICQSFGWILKSPDFIPLSMPQVKASSIGSGRDVPEYKTALGSMALDCQNMMGVYNVAIQSPGILPQVLALEVSKAIEKTPRPGISNHLHILLVGAGCFYFGNNDLHYLGQSKPVRKMPEIANNRIEFLSLLKSMGYSSTSAVLG